MGRPSSPDTPMPWAFSIPCGTLDERFDACPVSSLPIQVTRAALRPEDIIPRIAGVALAAGFKPLLHIKH